MTQNACVMILRCVGLLAARRLWGQQHRRAKWAASRRVGSRRKRTFRRSPIFASVSSFLESAIPLSSYPVEEITQHGAEQIRPSRMEHGGPAPMLGGLIVPSAALLITLGLLLGYFIGAGDRGAIQSAPIVAQNAPVPSPPGSQALFEGDAVTVGGAIPDADRDRIMSSLKSPLGPQCAFATISGVSGKNQVCAPNQSALKFP